MSFDDEYFDDEEPPKVKHSEIKKSNIIEAFFMKLLRGWGMLFRFIFICSIGYIGYSVFHVPSILDIPFSQLTIKSVAGSVFSIVIPFLCVGWFFNFPDYDEPEDKDNPYYLWAKGGLALIGAGVLFLLWLIK